MIDNNILVNLYYNIVTLNKNNKYLTHFRCIHFFINLYFFILEH